MSANPARQTSSTAWIESALAAYHPGQQSYELVSKMLMQDLLRNGAAALYRGFFTPGHFTASAWVVNPARTHILLIHHPKLHMWMQPGGHADGEADLLSVAMRELEEESGYTAAHMKPQPGIFDLDIHHYPAREKNGVLEPDHLHYDVRFLIEVDNNIPIPGSEENQQFRWLPLEECERIFPKTGGRARMLAKVMGKL